MGEPSLNLCVERAQQYAQAQPLSLLASQPHTMYQRARSTMRSASCFGAAGPAASAPNVKKYFQPTCTL